MRYYSLLSLKYLFDKYNLSIFHAKKIRTHGGSIRVYVAKKDKFKISKSVKKIIAEEKNFLNWKNFRKFKNDVVMSKKKIRIFLKKILMKKHKIYGIGGHSRESTLINYLGLTDKFIKDPNDVVSI